MGLRNRIAFSDCNCFFITTSCKDHLHLLKSESCKKIVCDSLNFLREKYKAHVFAYVLMANHIHLILYFELLDQETEEFSEYENRLSSFMRDLKKFTSFQIRTVIERTDPEVFNKLGYRHRKQLFKVWNDGFHDVWLGSRDLLESKLDYIHNNPLQSHWNLCERPEEYKFSSAMFYQNDIQPEVKMTHYMDFF